MLTTAERLGEFNDDLVAPFQVLEKTLKPVVTDQEWASFQNALIALTGAGWHSWEATVIALRVARTLHERLGYEQLQSSLDLSCQLADRSFKTSVAYLSLIEAWMKGELEKQVARAHALIEMLLESHPSRHNMLESAINNAWLRGQDEGSFEDWCAVVETLVPHRQLLSPFLENREISGQIDWGFIREIGVLSPHGIPVAMSQTPLALGLVSSSLHAELKGLIVSLASRQAFEETFENLISALRLLRPLERANLIQLIEALPSVQFLPQLLEGVPKLPMDRMGVLLSWVAGLDRFLPVNKPAAEAWLAVESRSSSQTLTRLLGQVDLTDIQQPLQYLSEAISGRRLRVGACIATSDDAHFRAMPQTDGLSVLLPEIQSSFEKREDNFRIYKMALLHQLGYFEFGTFEPKSLKHTGAFTAFTAHFNRYSQPRVARAIFQILEDARVDWSLERRYRGAAQDLGIVKSVILKDLWRTEIDRTPLGYLMGLSLDADPIGDSELFVQLNTAIAPLRDAGANVDDSLTALAACYPLIADHKKGQSLSSNEHITANDTFLPPAVLEFRGELSPDIVRSNLKLAGLMDSLPVGEDEGFSIAGMPDLENLKIESIEAGDLQGGLAVMLEDMAASGIESAEELDETLIEKVEPLLSQLIDRPPDDITYLYDEWDHLMSDYRKHWCTLFEIRRMDEDPEYIENARRELRDVGTRVRRQLSMLRPEMLVKIYGMPDGEELDMVNVVDAMVDRRMGASPSDRIYVQRQRKGRDVSALFLLDMSASTDDRMTDPNDPEPDPPGFDDDEDDFGDLLAMHAEQEKGRRIIDVEKQSVMLMADALEQLGDNYAIAGFSGYGRDRVEYYLCKDFDEPYDLKARGRLGGIRPCRSTRMGPAIRHAAKRLVATESRIKALIILSDGYPQDFDYGKDRNSRQYGIRDTTVALGEARQKGVQPFCITVDQSGHDYLREMCPDQQYMVIHNIDQLPDELSKVYRSLTG